MKKITKYLLIASAIIFANSSCTVEKRLHNPGYHVQLNKTTKVANSVDKVIKVEEEIASAEIKSDVASLPKIEEQVKTNSATVSTTEVEANYSSDVASNDESISIQKLNSPKRSLIQSNYAVDNQTTNVKKQELEKEAKISNSNAASAAGGASLLILVILCLFPLINLIPVYITDGGITLNFWVTLILNLTFIGAVIFSLLVVLGVVSLA